MNPSKASEGPGVQDRIERALALRDRYPEAREALEFYAAIAGFRGDWQDLRAVVAAKGPSLLREAAGLVSEIEFKAAVDRYLHGEDRESPASFFARVMLRHSLPKAASPHANRCPHCGGVPQCGCMRPEGHGSAFFLVCNVCASEWAFPRAQCPVCGEMDRAVFYGSERMDHIQVQVCEHCNRYFHVIHAGKDPRAVPEADEVAAIALDVWAHEQGWDKILPNLIGI
ncbi:MAG: formate dehydrogenase accessory protein FdhE [Bryobacterales bacterium]|nr:formate dehydrogenase accessory protein FdhE [Bryobacterales bacterium]